MTDEQIELLADKLAERLGYKVDSAVFDINQQVAWRAVLIRG